MGLEAINTIRKKLNMNLDELAAKSGVPIGTLSKISAGITKDPKLETVKAIAHALNCSLDSFDETLATLKSSKLNSNELEHIKKYRALSKIGRDTVDKALNNTYDYERAFEESTANVIEFHRQFPLYQIPASAGTGQFLDSEEYEIVEVGSEAPSQTNFLLRVIGDSMEPKICDGEILYIKQQQDVETGEIGVFYYDGNVFVKKLEYKNGAYCFISLNPAYAPISIESDNYRCYGKVLNK